MDVQPSETVIEYDVEIDLRVVLIVIAAIGFAVVLALALLLSALGQRDAEATHGAAGPSRPALSSLVSSKG